MDHHCKDSHHHPFMDMDQKRWRAHHKATTTVNPCSIRLLDNHLSSFLESIHASLIIAWHLIHLKGWLHRGLSPLRSQSRLHRYTQTLGSNDSPPREVILGSRGSKRSTVSPTTRTRQRKLIEKSMKRVS